MEPRTCVDPMHLHARGAYFWVFCHAPTWSSHTPACEGHAPAWVEKVSHNLIHFKARLRGFHGGYKLNLERHKRELEIGKGVIFSGGERVGNTIGVQGLRGLDLWHIILFFFFYFHDYEL